MPYAMHDTERHRPLSGPLGLRGVGHGQNRGSIHRSKGDAPSFVWRRHEEHIRGGFKYPRASACFADRTTTVRLDLGTLVPPTRLSEPMTLAMSHVREATWQIQQPVLAFPFGPGLGRRAICLSL